MVEIKELEKLLEGMRRTGFTAQIIIADEIENCINNDDNGTDEDDTEISEASQELLLGHLQDIADAALSAAKAIGQ